MTHFMTHSLAERVITDAVVHLHQPTNAPPVIRRRSFSSYEG